LRLRQIMLASDNDPCPPNPIAMGITYYSCANVTINADTTDMADVPEDLARPADLSVVGTTPSGCHAAPHSITRTPFSSVPAATLVLSYLALLLRRRRRS
jgi:hypothetical protein